MWPVGVTRLMLLVVLAAVAYFAFAGVSNALQTQRLRQDEERLHRQIDQLQQDYRRLVGLYEYMNSDEYIESVARQQLGLVRPDETPIFVLPPPADESEEEGPTPTGGRWWDAILER
ncbi:MAG: septum formation initiator family protein [Dehalococcoidia bacterium]